MSEESILTKDETINNPIENTAADTGVNVNIPDADASNILPFTSESPAEPDAVAPAAETVTSASLTNTVSSADTVSSTENNESEGTSFNKTAERVKAADDDEFPEDKPEKRRFHFKKDDKEFFRDKWILSRISDDQLMDYLQLEQRRNELQQQAKDIKEKRIFKAFEITIGLAAIVAVIYLLRDNPTILVNILYITGILTAFWFWKNPRDK